MAAEQPQELLHASNYSHCLYGCDIDPLVTLDCPDQWVSLRSVAGLPVPGEHPARSQCGIENVG